MDLVDTGIDDKSTIYTYTVDVMENRTMVENTASDNECDSVEEV